MRGDWSSEKNQPSFLFCRRLVAMLATKNESFIRKRGYSPKEAAAATGLSLATINRGIADGSIPSTKYKDRRIISDETIERLISPADSAA